MKVQDSLKNTCDLLASAIPTRRQVLKAGLFASAMLMLPWQALARVGKSFADIPERSVNLYNVNTGEFLSRFVYWQDGNYIKEALDDINYILRDHRTDLVHPFDPQVIDQVFMLTQQLDPHRPFEVLSAFRSAETNQELRRKSRRVARHSLHIEARALDLRLPGVPTAQLRKAAVSLEQGGVGYYPQRGFVHIDSGPIRRW